MEKKDLFEILTRQKEAEEARRQNKKERKKERKQKRQREEVNAFA